jgi:fatty acid desaturase
MLTPALPASAQSPSARLLNEDRDAPFLRLMVQAGAWALVAPLTLFLAYRWWMTPLYLVVTMAYFFPPFTLMLHCTSHRPLFQKRVGWMNHLIPWVLSPFFGQTPATYVAHHIGMHHPENNLWDDHSSTMGYRRDSLRGFLHYFTSFLAVGIFQLVPYLSGTRRHKLARNAVAGEAGYWLVAVGLLFVNAPAALTVFFAPVLVARFFMMAGNWGQHAFVDAATPESAYRNSITCIDTPYNARCFNDGYHIGHHLQAKMHWTELPLEFEKNRARYGAERAIVFRGIDFTGVWFLLMLKRHKALARRVVPLGPETATPERAEQLLRERLKPLPRAEAAPVRAAA